MKKRMLSILFVLVMMIVLLPTTALAADDSMNWPEVKSGDDVILHTGSSPNEVDVEASESVPSEGARDATKCDVCGGCKDLNCTEEVCKEKCTMLTMDFADVEASGWYTEAVNYVYHYGLMQGGGNGLFDIDGTTSRATITTILWRLEGEPVVNYLMQYEDVSQDAWYAEAVRWATAEGIVTGYGTTFGAADEVTREQLAAMLYRYEQYKGGGFTGMWMFLLDATDRAEVSEWAYEAVCWMSMNGIMTGDGTGALHPKEVASRAEVAQILMNYLGQG